MASVAIPSALTRSHPPDYRHRRPEATLLYQVIEEYWPEFQIELAGRGKSLPAYITKECGQPDVIGQDDPVPRSTGMCESGHG